MQIRVNIRGFDASLLTLGFAGMALLGSTGLGMAQEAVVLPLDLDPLPEVSDDADWGDVTENRVFRWQATLGAHHEGNQGPLSTLNAGPGTVSLASLALDVTWANASGLSFDGRIVAHSEGGETDLFLQRARLEFAPADTGLRFATGKDYTAWSFTELAHVLDPSPREAARLDSGDTRVDLANPFVEFSFDTGGHELSLLAMSEGTRFSTIDSDPHLLALRYSTQLNDTSLTLQAIKPQDKAVELGFGISRSFGAAIVSFEASLGKERRLPLAMPLPNGGLLTGVGDRKESVQAVVSARAPISSQWQIEAAYLYNGHGYSDAEWANFRTAESAVLTAMGGGNFAFAGFLGEARAAHRDQYLRRNYLTIAASTVEDFQQWSLTVGSTFGLDDGGSFGFVTASRAIGDATPLDVSVSAGFGGDETEFGRRSKTASVKILWEF